MQRLILSATLAFCMIWQSVAQAQFGYGYYPGASACPYNFGAAKGASDDDDEVQELMQERQNKRAELKEKNRSLEAKLKKQSDYQDVINDALKDKWASPILQHMENGYQCCPVGIGSSQNTAQVPPPQDPTQAIPPPVPINNETQVVPPPGPPPPAPPQDAPPGPNPMKKGTPTVAPPAAPPNDPGVGTQHIKKGTKHKKPAVTPVPTPTPPPAPPAPEPGSDLYSPPPGNNAPIGAKNDQSPIRSDRSPASVVDRSPAQAAPADPPPGPPPGAFPPSPGDQSQQLAPPQGANTDMCKSAKVDPEFCGAVPGAGGGTGMQGRDLCPPLQPPFGFPAWMAICRDDGGIDSSVCHNPLYKSPDADAKSSFKCASAITSYRKLTKDIEKLQKQVAKLEGEIDDLADKIGEAKAQAKEDARLEAECDSCNAAGHQGGKSGGSGSNSWVGPVVGGLLAAGALGLGFVANNQLNKQNEALGYPGQSFWPYGGYWVGQGVSQALGYPFAGGGQYGGVGAGMNGGFGCAGTVGGGGFPYGPGGAVGPFGPTAGLYPGGGGAFGSPYGYGQPQWGGGLYNNGLAPWGINGPGGFGSPYSGGVAGLGAGYGGGIPGGGIVPYGSAAGGPFAFGAYPGVPGAGGYPYGSGLGPTYAGGLPYGVGGAYNSYNPLGSNYGGYGAGSGVLAYDYYQRSLGNGAVGAGAYSSILGNVNNANANLFQLNSGFGAVPTGYSGSPYSVSPAMYGSGYFNGLGVGNNGVFGGVSPLGTVGNVNSGLPR